MRFLFSLGLAAMFAVIQPGIPRATPPAVAASPSPTGYSLPGLGKLLSNQSFQIWILQQQVKTLEQQVKTLGQQVTTLQSTAQSNQNTIAKLQQNLSTLQQAFNTHYHMYNDAGTAVYVTTIPHISCTRQSMDSCFVVGTLTILGYQGPEKQAATSTPSYAASQGH